MAEELHGEESMELLERSNLPGRVDYRAEERPSGTARQNSSHKSDSTDKKRRSTSLVNLLKTCKPTNSLSKKFQSVKDFSNVDSDSELENSMEEKVLYETVILNNSFKPPESSRSTQQLETTFLNGLESREILPQTYKNDNDGLPEKELPMSSIPASVSNSTRTHNVGTSTESGFSVPIPHESNVDINNLERFYLPAKNSNETQQKFPVVKVKDACLNYRKINEFLNQHVEMVKSTYKYVAAFQLPDGLLEYVEKIETPYVITALSDYIVNKRLSEVVKASKAVPFSQEDFYELVGSTTHLGWKIISISQLMREDMLDYLNYLEHTEDMQTTDKLNVVSMLDRTVICLQKIEDDMIIANDTLMTSKPGHLVNFGPRQRNALGNYALRSGFGCNWRKWCVFMVSIILLVALVFIFLVVMDYFSKDNVADDYGSNSTVDAQESTIFLLT